MQVSAIQALNKLRENGTNKALLISATGCGKTYLSAFDLRNFNPRRALFIIHREQIAKQALCSFRNIFGDTKSMGILSGNSKAIDEDHKAGSTSYQKIADYFQPKFLLGMTATPERNDDFDIFKMFNYKVA